VGLFARTARRSRCLRIAVASLDRPAPLLARADEVDKALLDRLEKCGFRLHFGEDDTGFQMMYLRRGGGYYFNVGCSELIISGQIKLLQYADIEKFVAEGARLRADHDARGLSLSGHARK